MATIRRRVATRSGASRDVPIRVKFAIMGNGVFPQCVKKGSTIAELFKQAGFDAAKSLRGGAVIRLDGRLVDGKAVISRDQAVVTSTSAVRGGR